MLRTVSIHNLNVYPGSLYIDAKRLFFVDAPESTRKTLLTTAIQRYIKSKRLEKFAFVSSTVSSHILDGGQTVHSADKTSIPAHYESKCFIDVNSALAGELFIASLFILYEIIMAHRHSIEPLDQPFRNKMRSMLPFNRKYFLFLGVFRQVSSVVRVSNRY